MQFDINRIALKSCYLGFFVFAIYGIANAQTPSQSYKLANESAKQKDYNRATHYYKSAWTKIENDKKALVHAGICAYQANELDFAIHCFERSQTISDAFDPQTNWYLAKSYHGKNEFEKAGIAYKRYLKIVEDDEGMESLVKNELLRCEYGMKYKRKQSLALVEPLSNKVNTHWDELAVVPDPLNKDAYYLSAVRSDCTGGMRNEKGLPDQKSGRLRADIFYIKEDKGNWELSRLNENEINSNMEDVVLGMEQNNNKLIFYRSWNDDSGEILSDVINKIEFKTSHEVFNSPMRDEWGDHALSLFNDSLIIFSSSRFGGYGGYDLYISIKKDGSWSGAINLGPGINTCFNEDYPFLAQDGLTLYYSSDRLESLGGFDIFRSRYYPEAQLWSTPLNLGVPVNSAGNDIHFKLRHDGLAAIFSSDRKTENQGGYDLYFAYFKGDLAEELTASTISPLNNLLDIKPETISITTDNALQEAHQSKVVAWKNYFIEPIFYSDDLFLQEAKTKRILDLLAAMLESHPGLSVEFIAHSPEENKETVNLYFAVKKAEELENYLLKKNINASRIHSYGVGSSLPFARPEINGNKSPLAQKLNKRIEINIRSHDSIPVKLNYINNPIPENLKPVQRDNWNTLRKGFTYSLYLGESAGIFNHPLLNSEPGFAFAEKLRKEERYKYYFGSYKTYDEAASKLQLYNAKFGISLEIRGFNATNELNRNEIIQHVLEHPDLLNYLNYLNALHKNR